MNDVLAHELYSLLVPLAQERLIVPRACVAEVVTWQAPEKMEGAPPWYLGTIHWSGRAVPVISFVQERQGKSFLTMLMVVRTDEAEA